jgi:hypothetical protein
MKVPWISWQGKLKKVNIFYAKWRHFKIKVSNWSNFNNLTLPWMWLHSSVLVKSTHSFYMKSEDTLTPKKVNSLFCTIIVLPITEGEGTLNSMTEQT